MSEGVLGPVEPNGGGCCRNAGDSTAGAAAECSAHPEQSSADGDRAPQTSTTTRGYNENKDNHLRRLRRIEGQVRGLARMIEQDEYCIDVLTQVSATTRALQSMALGLLDEHLKGCVTSAIHHGDDADAKIAEAAAAIARLVKS
jgi:DNA-binding FrmR family transcriptional regulator